ncbi:ML domain-containing protein [Streptomyces wedmorensis]|uniref:ML domain-containing protein n=1 Tax=Streptomyces wedmorensis TaxID=43759 RepID=UPI00343560F9
MDTHSHQSATFSNITRFSIDNHTYPTSPLHITSITVDPDPKPGAAVVLTIKGRVQEAIEDGAYYKLSIKNGLITMANKTVDLFEEVRNGSLEVTPDPAGGPIKPGEVEMTYRHLIPSQMMPGEFKVVIDGVTAADTPLGAFTLRIDFTR